MNKNINQKRSRNRGNSGRRGQSGGQSRSNVFDSNGPEVKVRGTAQQVLDKYLQLARDAQSSGDRVRAEGLLQFAEHYYRVINAEGQSAPVAASATPAEQGSDQSEPAEAIVEVAQPVGQQAADTNEGNEPSAEKKNRPRPRRTNGRNKPANKDRDGNKAEAASA